MFGKWSKLGLKSIYLTENIVNNFKSNGNL